MQWCSLANCPAGSHASDTLPWPLVPRVQTTGNMVRVRLFRYLKRYNHIIAMTRWPAVCVCPSPVCGVACGKYCDVSIRAEEIHPASRTVAVEEVRAGW